ncbi:MAG TPA: hypothetical protein VLG50_05925 [Candidatus Saccharimonadales bacterium]|nr:hypothetical protein [Candidatus Saccharimonadales bacterium]
MSCSKSYNHKKKHCKDVILKKFKGVNGYNIIPADANCAVGEKDYITMVNSSIIFYDKCSNKINAQYPLSSFPITTMITNQPFFPIDNFMSDPWIVYDPHVKRFALVALAFIDSNNARLYFAVSKSETFCDYLNDWNKYFIDFGYGSADNFPDYPKLGFDAKHYYITARVFLNPGFEDRIYGFTKKEVLKGEPINEVVNTAFGGGVDFIHPLKVFDCHTPMVFVFSDLVTNPATTIFFITINFVDDLPVVNGPISFTVEPYYQPDDVTQLGGSQLDTLGSMFMSGSLRHKHIWISHTVGLSDGGVKTRWYDIIYDGISFVMNQFQTIGLCDLTTSYWMSHIDVDCDGNMGLGFSYLDSTSPNGAGLAATGRLRDDIPYSTHMITILKKGKGIYNIQGEGVNRWGDYSGCCYDPCHCKQFWIFNQYGYDTSVITNVSFKTQNALFELVETDLCCQQLPPRNNNVVSNTDVFNPHAELEHVKRQPVILIKY